MGFRRNFESWVQAGNLGSFYEESLEKRYGASVRKWYENYGPNSIRSQPTFDNEKCTGIDSL